MPLDVAQFLTPFPGPFRYSSPAAIGAAGAINDRAERARAADMMAGVQQEATDAANRRAGAQLAFDAFKFNQEHQAKLDAETDEIRKRWLTAVMNQDETGANALAAELRSRGVDVQRRAGSPAPQKTPDGGAEQPPSAPTSVPSEPSLAPWEGLRPAPQRRETIGQDTRTSADRFRCELAQRTQNLVNAAPGEAPAPTAREQGEATQETLAKAGQQRAVWGMNRPTPPPGLTPGAFTPPTPEQKAGWTVTQNGREVFNLDDDEVATFRGRTIAQHFGPRMAEAKKPYEVKAAREGMRVALENGGVPLDKALEAGEEAYQFEIRTGAGLEQAGMIARAKAASLARQDRLDPYEVRKDAVSNVRQIYKVDQTGRLYADTQAMWNALDETAFQSGTVNNMALLQAIKTYQKGVTTDRDYNNMAMSTGLPGVIQSIEGWFSGTGKVGKDVLLQVKQQLARAIREQQKQLQDAAQAAYDWEMSVRELNPSEARPHAEAAAKTIYPYWQNKSEQSAPTAAAPRPGTSSSSSSGFSALKRFAQRYKK